MDYISGSAAACKFLSTLSLRRATLRWCASISSRQFLSTLSLRRATTAADQALLHFQISIHALLAESDFDELVLPEGMDISIHALLAESDFSVSVDSFISVIFLSTLSLRRATSPDGRRICNRPYFYPRSPCGERPALYCVFSALAPISIHALLAESDVKLQLYFINQKQFLSTLSLRRATVFNGFLFRLLFQFLSTLSLRRATRNVANSQSKENISIHALLAESDPKQPKHQ